MKLTFTSILIAVAGLVFGQTADAVNTQGGSLDVYYNLNTQDDKSLNTNNWDIAFTTQGFDAGILVNENKGVAVFAISSDTNAWMSIDTANFDFASNMLYNSTESWSVGALNTAGSGHPDYGWGRYESSNHHVYGTRIFIVHAAGKWLQLQISEMTVSGLYRIKTADIGGANTQYYHIAKADHTEDNFVPLDLSALQLENEPNSDEWHLLFTRYYSEVQGQKYRVSGVKMNKGLKVAERIGVAVTDNDTTGLFWSENITEIGYDWKTFNGGTFSYDITPDLSYFIKNDNGEVWKIWFTAYSGGEFTFNVEKVGFKVSVAAVEKHDSKIYPNPAQAVLHFENNASDKADVQFWTLDGRMVLETKASALQTTAIDISTISKGCYIVRVNGQNASTTHRLIVE